ncbi:MAG: GNAT family N-acetyltransferase [Betaproteobacteria bacterium]|nr:GNAT family N-acetyltransferase [Betaproteobacteria bacterium]
MTIELAPVTAARFSDLEALFAGNGCAFARACWCMECRYRGDRPSPAPGQTPAEANRQAMMDLLATGAVPGLIGYRAATPVGWVALAPRGDYGRLQRSAVMKAVDAQPVWSVMCFVVPSAYRGQGVAQALLEGAAAYAKAQGAAILEAYPIDKAGRSNPGFLWFGAKAMFDKAGFEEVARRKPERPIVRLKLS